MKVLVINAGSSSLKYQPVSYTQLRAHETSAHVVLRILLEKK